MDLPNFDTVEAFEAFWSQVPDLIEIEVVINSAPASRVLLSP